MEHNQITKEWIDQQRENIQNAHRPFSPQRETARERIIFSTHETSINALEDSLKREADKDTEIARLKRSLSASRAFGSRLENIIGKRRKAILVDALHFTNAENIRLTAERDAEKKRADVAEHKIYEIAHTGLCGVCEQSFSVCDGHAQECGEGCPLVSLFVCGNVYGGIDPDEPCVSTIDAPTGAESEGAE